MKQFRLDNFLHSVHKSFGLEAILLVEYVVGVEHDVLHLVFMRDRNFRTSRNKLNNIILSIAGIRIAHIETKVLNVAIVVLDLHQVVVDLLVNLLEIINLVNFFDEAI